MLERGRDLRERRLGRFLFGGFELLRFFFVAFLLGRYLFLSFGFVVGFVEKFCLEISFFEVFMR